MGPINWHFVFFLLFSLVACGFAVAVVLSSNIVRMAFYLVLSLGAVSGLFFLAAADLVGSMQLLIYVGGTLVLLIFGVMLTAQAPFISMKTSSGDWILAVMLSGLLMLVLTPAIFSVRGWRNEPDIPAAEMTNGGERTMARHEPAVGPPVQEPTATPLGLALLGIRVDRLNGAPSNLQAGMSGYLLPFEIVSVHLLVVLIGAAYLARTKRRVTSREVA